MAKTVAIVNEDGGVGKSTTAFYLSRSLASKGKRVLLVDFDPLSDLPSALNLNLTGEHSFVDYLVSVAKDLKSDLAIDEMLRDEGLIYPTEYGFDVLSSGADLVSLEMKLLNVDSREFVLKRMLDGLTSNYDFIIIDTPSSCGLLTENALVSADYVLIPVRCNYDANKVLTGMLQTIISVRNQANGRLSILGILLTRCNPQGRTVAKISRELKTIYGEMMFTTLIFERMDVLEQYNALADEVMKRSL